MEIPSTNVILKKQLPIILPIAISYLFFNASVTVTANSGTDVPNATNVAAIISLGTLSLYANHITLFINIFDPKKIKIRPMQNIKNA